MQFSAIIYLYAKNHAGAGSWIPSSILVQKRIPWCCIVNTVVAGGWFGETLSQGITSHVFAIKRITMDDL